MIDLYEMKMVNAIMYFAKNTKGCYKTKLFKLLYFLDFISFKRYGFTVTGNTYKALPYGPVPIQLLENMSNAEPSEFFRDSIALIDEERSDGKIFTRIVPKKEPDLDWFNKNELKVLREVAEIFKEADTKLMVEATHLHNSPWDRTIKERGMYKEIDIMLAIDDETTLTEEELRDRMDIQQFLR